MSLNKELIDPYYWDTYDRSGELPMMHQTLGGLNQHDVLAVYNFLESVSDGPRYRSDGWTYEEINNQISNNADTTVSDIASVVEGRIVNIPVD